MEQLSLPYRIALGAILLFGVLYLFVLKGSGDAQTAAAPPAATAPGVAGLGKAVDKSNGAAATQSASDAATRSAAAAASGETTSAPATPAPAGAVGPATADSALPPQAGKTADGGDDPSAPILADLKQGHTAVVLFAGTKASDDRSVRRAVKRVDRRDGKVDVHTISIKRVADYEAITRGVDVLQSPTILVISKQRKARTIVGYTTTSEINQMVGDVRG